ncbi:MAG: 50S ribosomal protein L25/general stress protein Ctc [Alphaproteobacteria bacterium]|nr:50S ribosomal protein L25/general stress protein Ctc [Alphaproteobacteria bacterium]
MADVDIFQCEIRERTGKGGAREARRQGWVPAVLYGGGDKPVAINLREREVTKAYLAGRMKAHLAKIDVAGEDGQQSVIARDVQLDPVKDTLIHVDLMRVDEKTRIDVHIPVRFLNEEESPGLKKGGVLNIVRHEVDVYAPATAIPEIFEIDLTGLDVGDTIHVSAITLPDNVKLVITDRDYTIATIAAPSALRSADDEDADAEAEETTEDGAEATDTDAAAEGDKKE